MRTTSIPWSRNHSAIRVAVKAARSRTSAGWSEVATTTTERARPSGPRSRSRNSRTSRPRSPTRARTETWASVPRAIIDSRLDFPTPEPAKRPSRWPRPQGMRVSMARTPRGRGRSTLARSKGCGAVPSTVTVSRPAGPPVPLAGRGRSSIGWPSPSRTRPSSARPTEIVGGWPGVQTGAPVRRPWSSPKGMQTMRSPWRATTSPPTLPVGAKMTTASPMAASRPATSRWMPTTRSTRPKRRGRAASNAAATRRGSMMRTGLTGPPSARRARGRGLSRVGRRYGNRRLRGCSRRIRRPGPG